MKWYEVTLFWNKPKSVKKFRFTDFFDASRVFEYLNAYTKRQNKKTDIGMWAHLDLINTERDDHFSNADSVIDYFEEFNG